VLWVVVELRGLRGVAFVGETGTDGVETAAGR